MRIWRIEFGTWKRLGGFSDYDFFEYEKGMCGCMILTIGRVYFTYLNNECYNVIIKENK